MLGSLCIAVLASPAQDELPREEQERLVEAYLALDLSDTGDLPEARRVLETLEAVPFPSRSKLRRWERRVEDALEERLEARPVEDDEGEHVEQVGDRPGRYFLGGELRRPEGLFVGLHGGGAGSGDAGSSHASWSEACEELDWAGLFPEVLEKTEHGWTDSGTEEWVLDLTARVVATLEVDPDRVVIGGHSMGGYGGWVLGGHHADRFAAALASAGAPTPVYQGGAIVAVQQGVIPNLSALPLLVYQSTDDPKVPPDANQAAVQEVERARERWGGYEHFEYWEVTDRGHGFPEGGAGVLLEKLANFRRDPLPERFVWQPALRWKRQFYWLHWDEPDVGALVVAEHDGNEFSLDLRRTRGEGLSLLVNGDLVDLEEPVVVRVNGSKVFEGVVQPDFPTWLATRAHGDPGRAFVARVPLDG